MEYSLDLNENQYEVRTLTMGRLPFAFGPLRTWSMSGIP